MGKFFRKKRKKHYVAIISRSTVSEFILKNQANNFMYVRSRVEKKMIDTKEKGIGIL